MSRPRLLLADDHTIVIEGLKKLLEGEFDVVGTAEDGRTLIELALKTRPDVVVLDISMPGLNGIEAARQLRELLPRAATLFLTMHTEPVLVAAALQAGGRGYVLKRSAASELVAAIHEVLKRRIYITRLLPRETIVHARRRSLIPARAPGRLTPRQEQVVRLIAEGRTSREIAAALHISIKTVEFHRSNLLRQLGLNTTGELVKYAIQQGIVLV